ncbi:hypothetical protein [Methylomonas rivi]|uniref:Uncharacterized protein n=1 Tax=Methylomonas rivi TaxID=2952226 RepID=A0ABT1UA12_9GAMM|nr:hypothetical protein [Methylomonas sp. WSC-6]MCQ8130703.1 hypothetical protein [Methylomonas sp. WSC-6]
MKKIILCFVKFFDEEKYADEFIKGNLFFRRLLDFKKIEEEHDGVRQDENEGIFAWFQPKGILMTLNIKNSLGEDFEKIEITEKDLAAPISMSSVEHNYYHVFCMYAVCITDFEKHCDTEEEKQSVFEELNREKTQK